jgi:hypothetical protein
MIATLAAMAMVASAQPLRILFVGNSHTAVNDLPAMVQKLVESDGSGRTVVTKQFFVEFLNEGLNRPDIMREVANPAWDIVVLQAAKASSSHKFVYDNSGSSKIARIAHGAGSRTLFFVEWPRRDWDESEFQMGVYRPIAKDAPGSELVPVCYAWDAILKKAPNLNLWAPDGNHASEMGTYLAANVFYYYLSGESRTPHWSPTSIPANVNRLIEDSAKAALASHKAAKKAS